MQLVDIGEINVESDQRALGPDTYIYVWFPPASLNAGLRKEREPRNGSPKSRMTLTRLEHTAKQRQSWSRSPGWLAESGGPERGFVLSLPLGPTRPYHHN
jgi:hypothetical protein